MSPMVLENDVEVGESLPPSTEHVGHRKPNLEQQI
jgi:hypothetical protein